MKKIFFLLIAAFIILAGCVGPSTETTTSPTGEVTTEVKTEEGTVTVTAKEGAGPEWCKAGSSMNAAGPAGQMTWTVKGFTTYKGRQVCELEVKASGEKAGEVTWMTQYFNEDSSYVAIVYRDQTGKIVSEYELKQ